MIQNLYYIDITGASSASRPASYSPGPSPGGMTVESAVCRISASGPGGPYIARNRSGSQDVFTVLCSTPAGMYSMSPGVTSRSSSAMVWTPSPLRTKRTSSLSGWVCRSWPFPGSSTTTPALNVSAPVVSGVLSHLIVPQSRSSVSISSGRMNRCSSAMTVNTTRLLFISVWDTLPRDESDHASRSDSLSENASPPVGRAKSTRTPQSMGICCCQSVGGSLTHSL